MAGEVEQDERALRSGATQIEELRRRLLDLRTSSRLLHFPHTPRGRNYVRAVDEAPETLHQQLVDGRTLRIVPLPEPPLLPDEPADASLPPVEDAARFAGIDPSFSLPIVDASAPRRAGEDILQTLLYPELHQKVLANIADVTRSAREEQGIHTLFAAFGFVEWYERAGDSARFAPLLLLPLTLHRERELSLYESLGDRARRRARPEPGARGAAAARLRHGASAICRRRRPRGLLRARLGARAHRAPLEAPPLGHAE